jgi:hypothetical protein
MGFDGPKSSIKRAYDADLGNQMGKAVLRPDIPASISGPSKGHRLK